MMSLAGKNILKTLVFATGFILSFDVSAAPFSVAPPPALDSVRLPAAYQAPLLRDNSIPGVAAETIYRSAALIYTNSGVCMGLLVAQDLVLTAGHCVKGVRDIRVRLYQGLHDRTPVHRQALDWTFHPNSSDMDPNVGEDIGMILIKPAPSWNRPVILFRNLVTSHDPADPVHGVDENGQPFPLQPLPNQNLFMISRAIEDYENLTMPDLRISFLVNHGHYGDSRSKNFYATHQDIGGVQPLGCKGDSGAPILTVANGQLGSIGVYYSSAPSAVAPTVTVDGIKCNRHPAYYNTSLSLNYIFKMQDHLYRNNQERVSLRK